MWIQNDMFQKKNFDLKFFLKKPSFKKKKLPFKFNTCIAG